MRVARGGSLYDRVDLAGFKDGLRRLYCVAPDTPRRWKSTHFISEHITAFFQEDGGIKEKERERAQETCTERESESVSVNANISTKQA